MQFEVKFYEGETVRKFHVRFQKLRRTPNREKWFPITAVSATQAAVVDLTEGGDEATCTACGFGLSYRYKKDPPDPELGQRLALRRALQSFEPRVRAYVWGHYLNHFPPHERRRG